VIHALDHVSVLVKDLGKATEAWSTVLGRPPSWRGEHESLGTRSAYYRLRNTYLELLTPSTEARFAHWLVERLEREGEGPLILGFATDDADTCARELRAAGIAARDPRYGEAKDLDSGEARRFRSVLWPAESSRGLFAFAIEHISPRDSLPLRDPVGAPEASVEALDHVVVQTQDPEDAIRLYQDRLGLRLALDRSFPERRVRLLFFRIGGVTVELAARLDVPADPAAPDRLWGLAFRAHDVRAARERLRAAGVDVSETRRGNKPGTAVCTVRGDPTGVPTLLIGPD
jgi:catechol 2,3-dioxygenase-like lactoylglutathione lyase family enzyme